MTIPDIEIFRRNKMAGKALDIVKTIIIVIVGIIVIKTLIGII